MGRSGRESGYPDTNKTLVAGSKKVGRTWCFNPGVTTEASIQNHIVIDLLAETATLRVVDQGEASVRIPFERDDLA